MPDLSQLPSTLLGRLLDDASLFPPAKLAMRAAVTAHARHATAWYRGLTGPFVCPDTRISELGTVLTTTNAPWIDLCLVVTGGAGAVAAATDAVAADPRLRLRAIEVPAARSEDPGEAVAQAAAALDAVPLAGATGYIEMELGALADPERAAPLLAATEGRGYRPKLRTGGLSRDAFPDEATLASCLAVLTERRTRFKCTAGLHHAVRHTAAETGFEHHGFLNVLLAVGGASAGARQDEVAGILALRDPAEVAARVLAIDPGDAEDIRWLFTSFGTCSVDDPVADLVSLGLLSHS